ncbi:MAG TPA: hypothetical protein VMH22_00760 [bacterium]|nr:hypothetical protein [bacterium]
MPTKLRLELNRMLGISLAALSPTYGCGSMLRSLPRFSSSDPLLDIMSNYGYQNVAGDKVAQRLVANPGLLKQFHENAFSNKLPLSENYKNVYGHLDVFLATDAAVKTAWFVADPPNRVALLNYDRDAVSFGLKPLGVLLLGSTVRLTAAGWQNLHDLLTDEFFNIHPGIQRVEITGVLDGVRWRTNTLSLGVTMLNFRELPEIQTVVVKTLLTRSLDTKS